MFIGAGLSSVWIFAATFDSKLGVVYIIEFLKVFSLLWYKIWGDLDDK